MDHANNDIVVDDSFVVHKSDGTSM